MDISKKDYLESKKNLKRMIRRHNKFLMIGRNKGNLTIAMNASIYKFSDRMKLATLECIYKGQR